MTPILIWDASALAKRYIQEPGSDTVDALFAQNAEMALSYIGYAETTNIIRRFYNRGQIKFNDFQGARYRLERETLDNDATLFLSVDDAAILSSIVIADTHNLNSTDAALLYVFREWAQEMDRSCFLIAADLRFIRAATAEGLNCLNPELIRPAELGAHLSRE